MRSGDSSAALARMLAPHEKIYVREVAGRHARWRRASAWLTQLVFYGLPWLQWNGRPAVLFDLAARKFTIFGLVLWPQDFIYLAIFLILCACLMFFLSAVAGRVWCSYACPHTVYSGIFMWIECSIEGGRGARMQLDRQPPSVARLRKKTAKHLAWIAVSAWTGITLVAYFTPMHTLLGEIAGMALGPWQAFWILFYAGLTYLNAGWMREQICKYLCAYARFQSVMFDRDTLVVTYDRERGEPRGLRRKNRDPRAARQGDCIDCTICIQVCPAGIDIRNGFQYDCIDCAACIDACDAVMDKTGAARGLIRYTTENAIGKRLSRRQAGRRLLRPRVLVYTCMLVAGMALYVFALASRAPLKLGVILDRGTIGRKVEGGMLENVYRLQIMNADERTRHYRIAVTGVDTILLAGDNQVTVEGVSSRSVPVRVRIAAGQGKPGANRIRFELEAQDGSGLRVAEPAVFFIPERQ